MKPSAAKPNGMEALDFMLVACAEGFEPHEDQAGQSNRERNASENNDKDEIDGERLILASAGKRQSLRKIADTRADASTQLGNACNENINNLGDNFSARHGSFSFLGITSRI